MSVHGKGAGKSDIYEKGCAVLLELVGDLIDSLRRDSKLPSVVSDTHAALSYFRATIQSDPYSESINTVENILETLTCSICNNAVLTAILNCNHSLCDDCIERNFSEKRPPHRLTCPICRADFLPFELTQEFFEEWKKAQKRSGDICLGCEKSIQVTRDCRHFCDNCLCNKYRLGQMHCDECRLSIEMPADLFHKETICQGCKCNVYLFGDYVFTMEDGHSLCFMCARTTKNTSQCQGCQRRISTSEGERLTNFIYKKCESCDSLQELPLIIPKQCCPKLICGKCQSPRASCSYCNTDLDSISKSFVERFTESKRKLNLVS